MLDKKHQAQQQQTQQCMTIRLYRP